jgi:hypothetical protein
MYRFFISKFLHFVPLIPGELDHLEFKLGIGFNRHMELLGITEKAEHNGLLGEWS